ncbi:MAG: ribonuclease E/G [Hyphomonas sp.]|uniref:Rne/Rng family ribonuclease n=3 Tax=Hyphomonas TaxID=85 RepID=UPI000C4A8A65|nr:ribonuclease E/G [Hyphomonas sp.]HCN92562.1 ribonuclease E/G [Hyphomonas sp.]|tara:strand:+ start:237943 stop:240540 length:2598 start_codon:yes stop_codon:yes gene_type:complete
MSKLMLIDASHTEETRVAIVNNGQVDDFDFETTGNEQLRGNIYLAKVTRVEPSLQAAFVEYGGNRHGFLAFSEIHPDYYQLPAEDREALLKEAAEEAAAQIEDDDDEDGDAVDIDDEDDVDNDASDDDSDESEDSTDNESGEAKAAAAPRRKKSSRASISKRYKIQEVIRRRQVMLVQVVKEERGNKGAALTTYLSLAGRYSVLMPNTPRGGGISRKIVNGADRKRLKSIVSELDVPDGMGLIVRTAGAKRTKAEIKRDYEYLSKLWENIVEKTLTSEAPMLINAEGGLVHRAMRDMFDKDIEEVLVHGEEAYREAKDLAKLIMPSQSKKVQQWKEEDPLFVAEAVEQQLDSIYSPTVQLKSGGYLVINQTEALVAIDVNSGKSTRERNIEQTAVRTNLEAAEEACRQMRLRDLAGLIVIDFIDMDENKNNRAVEKKLKDHLKVDRARVQHGRISQFGLMEISRQRRRQGVLQATSDPCEACNGTGRRRSIPSAALQLIRAIEARASMGGLKAISVKAPTDVALYLLNNKREALVEVEQVAGFAVSIHSSEDMLPGDFVIDAERDPNGKPKKRKPPRSLAKPSKQIVSDDEDEDDESEDDTSEASADQDDESTGTRRKRRRRRGGRGRKQEAAESQDDESRLDGEDAEDDGDDTAEAASDSDDDSEDGAPRKRRRRGRRGGRRRRRSSDTRTEATDGAPADGGAYLDGLAASAPEMLDDIPPSEAKVSEEPAAEDTPSKAQAEETAPSEAQAEDAPADSEEKPAKPKRPRRSRAKKKDAAVAAETSSEAEASEPAKAEPAPEAEPIVEAKPDPVAEKPAPEPKPEPEAEPAMADQAAPEPAPEPAAKPAKKAEPKRSGWWSRAKR